MPRKKSIKRSATRFLDQVYAIDGFLRYVTPHITDDQVSWIHEYAVLRLYREFERLVLECLVGAINNDTEIISTKMGIAFPKHLTDEVCEYLVIADGYLDFRGRAGLIRLLKRFVPGDHYLVEVIKRVRYRDSLERLSALRNLAAHSGAVAKRRAKDVLQAERLGSAGTWLKREGRMQALLDSMAILAADVRRRAPY
jgi:hypothetical protein